MEGLLQVVVPENSELSHNQFHGDNFLIYVLVSLQLTEVIAQVLPLIPPRKNLYYK